MSPLFFLLQKIKLFGFDQLISTPTIGTLAIILL